MAVFTVSRGNSSESGNPLTVNLAVGGTATFFVDYQVNGVVFATPTTASVVIPAGKLSVDFEVIFFNDGVFESAETVVVEVLPGPGVVVGVNPSAACLAVQRL